MNDPFTISATTPAGATFTTTAPNPGAAFAVARLLHDQSYNLHTQGYNNDPITWRLDPAHPALVEAFVRVDGGPLHLVLITPGQTIAIRGELESCCAAALPLDGDQVQVSTVRGASGIPCPLCHTAWSARYAQATATFRAVA